MAKRAEADPLAGVSTEVVPVYCAHTERVDPATLVGNPGNPNVHPPAQIALLALVIAAQGWRAPITVSTRSGFVVRGHGRLAAALLLGPTRCPAVPVDRQGYASAAAEYADLIADNRIAELAETDEARLAALVAEVAADAAWDPALTGYDAAALDRLVARVAAAAGPREDEPGEPPAAPITQLGDLWVLGPHRILCGDSTDPAAVARLLDGARAVLMQTDPPYGIAYVANAKASGKACAHEDIENDGLDGAKLQAFLEATIRAAVPHLTENAAFYLWHPMLTQGTFFAAAAAADILIHRQIIWCKPSLILGRGDYHWQHELCFYGWRRGHRPPFYGTRNQTTLWMVGRETSKEHPTAKPVDLWMPPIQNHTSPGEVCYEPFSGSGSQIIACEQTGRRCYAMELSPAYVDVAVRRWQALTGKRATHATTGAPYPEPA